VTTTPREAVSRYDRPEHVGHRRRDKRRWCRGREGVPHAYPLACRLSKHVGRWTCRWASCRDPYWICWHETYCTNCDKVMEHLNADRCPDNPGTQDAALGN